MRRSGSQSGATSFGVIVLAGGASTRMGSDKASLVVDGVPMLQRVVTSAVDAGATHVLIAGPASRSLTDRLVDEYRQVERVDDASPDGPQSPIDSTTRNGPLAGVVGAWPKLAGLKVDPIVILSCDLPGIDATAVRTLANAASKHDHGVMAHDGAQPQPLVAAYRQSTLQRLEVQFLAGQRSITRALGDLAMGTLSFSAEHVGDADRPSDLAGRRVQWPAPESPT